jgi:peptidoglycan/LPS O-acetylase OafA/YrhL
MENRPEINGLRALAILSVLIYHSEFTLFGHTIAKGGFLGVDIFFVISGYLITRILINEIYITNKINFYNFIERRARRILPALFIVFIVTSLVSYFYLLPNNYLSLSKSILASVFFVSNIYFYSTNIAYESTSLTMQPLLNTWSLGVEEQFYLIVPTLLLVLYKYLRKYLFIIFYFFVFISFILCVVQTDGKQINNFYLIAPRFWEIGVGSLLSFIEFKKGRVNSIMLNITMPIIGIALLGYCIIFFNIYENPHPSIFTLIPIIGTSLIIIFSNGRSDIVGKILSMKLIVFIGLISYSLYLWHYPILVFANGIIGDLSSINKVFLIILMFAISVISYKYIETPFRNKNIIPTKKFIQVLILFVSILVLYNFIVLKTNGLNLNKNKKFISNNKILEIEDIDPKIWDGINKEYLIIGDSHADKLSFGLNYITAGRVLRKHGGGCLPFRDITRWDSRFSKYNCSSFINMELDKLKNNPQIHSVILTSMGPVYLDGTVIDNDTTRLIGQGVEDLQNPNELNRYEIYKNGLIRTVAELIENNKKIIFFIDVPEYKIPNSACTEKLHQEYRPYGPKFRIPNTDKCKILKSEYLERTKKFRELIYKTLSHYSEVTLIDPLSLMCDETYCYKGDKDGFYFTDNDHLSKYGSVFVAENLFKFMMD